MILGVSVEMRRYLPLGDRARWLAEKERCSSPCVLRLIFLLSCMESSTDREMHVMSKAGFMAHKPAVKDHSPDPLAGQVPAVSMQLLLRHC